jgi:periplasmic protein TonB
MHCVESAVRIFLSADKTGVDMGKKLLTALAQCLVLLTLGSAVMAADTKATLDSTSPCAPPDYPRASLSNEEKGVVLVGVLVSVDGKAVETKVEKSSGYRNLDRAAATAFGKCKFKPASKDGKPDQQWASISFEFKLE